MSAPLKRRIALLEAQLYALKEKLEQHQKIANNLLYENTELRMRNEAAAAALIGVDYFEAAA
jgi:regulator of replication initiation timing